MITSSAPAKITCALYCLIAARSAARMLSRLGAPGVTVVPVTTFVTQSMNHVTHGFTPAARQRQPPPAPRRGHPPTPRCDAPAGAAKHVMGARRVLALAQTRPPNGPVPVERCHDDTYSIGPVALPGSGDPGVADHRRRVGLGGRGPGRGAPGGSRDHRRRTAGGRRPSRGSPPS